MFTLRVTNFQSIQDIELQVQGLTVLTAPSHSGKSAIVRAVDTLLTVNWFQEAYQRKGCNLTTVALKHNSDEVEFIRKGATTTFKINGASFGKLGRKVPPELLALGYGEVQVSESASEIVTILPQIQNQFDAPYQDSIKPSALTQLLGSFTNLAPYQLGLDRAKKQQGDARREVERLQKDRIKLSAIAETLDTYNPTETQRSIELLVASIASIDSLILTLSSLVPKMNLRSDLSLAKSIKRPFGSGDKTYSATKTLLVSMRSFIKSIEIISICVSKYSNLTASRSALGRCYPPSMETTTSIIKLIQDFSSKCHKHIRYTELRNYEKLKYSEVLERVPLAINEARKIIKMTKVSELNEKYVSSISAMDKLTGDRETYKQTFDGLHSRHKSILESLDMGRCPLCLNAFDANSVSSSGGGLKQKKLVSR